MEALLIFDVSIEAGGTKANMVGHVAHGRSMETASDEKSPAPQVIRFWFQG